MNIDNIDDFLKEHEWLVDFVIKNDFPKVIWTEDLHQIGMIGLWKATQTYEEDKGATFKSYARIIIKRDIALQIREDMRIKRTLNNTANTQSLEYEYESDGECGITLKDWIPDNNVDYCEMQTDLEIELKDYDEIEREIVYAKINDRPLTEVALKYGRSRQAINSRWKTIKERLGKKCLKQ